MESMTPAAPRSAQVPLALVGTLAFVFALRLAHLSSTMLSPLTYQLGPDEDYYLRFGQAVAAGMGQDSPEFTFMDPGYGYLLGALFKLTGANLFVVFALQCVLDTGNAGGILVIGRQLGRPRAGIYGALLYGATSTALMFCTALLKEVWVTAFMTWWVVIALAAVRSPRKVLWFGFGIFCGCGVACRSTFLLLALAAALLPAMSMAATPRTLAFWAARCGPLAAGLLLALLPWSLRNLHAEGSITPLPHNGGIVLHQAYNPQNPDSSIWIPPFVNYLQPSEIWRGYAAEASRRAGHVLTPGEVNTYWQAQAMDFIVHHPTAVLRAVATKFLKFFAAADVPINRSLQEESLFSHTLKLLPWPAPWLLALGFVGLVWLALDDRRWLIVGTPILLALFTFAVFWAEDRFRFHTLPVLALCAGIWIDLLVQHMRARQWRPAAWSASAAAVLFAGSTALGATMTPTPLHWDQIVWGYIKMGKPLEARRLAVHVAGEQPENAPIQEALGYLAVMQQDYPAAAAAYSKAIALRPRSDQAHYNLAKVLARLGEHEHALQQATVAADLNPDPANVALLRELQSQATTN